jgi:hypothetical protein
MFYNEYLKFKTYQVTRVEIFENKNKKNYNNYSRFLAGKYEQNKFSDIIASKCTDFNTNIKCQTGNNDNSIAFTLTCTDYGIQSINTYFNSEIKYQEQLIREFLINYYTNNFYNLYNFYNLKLDLYTSMLNNNPPPEDDVFGQPGEPEPDSYTVSIRINFTYNDTLITDTLITDTSTSESMVNSLNILFTRIDPDFFQLANNDIIN